MDRKKGITKEVFAYEMERLTCIFGDMGSIKAIDTYYDLVKTWSEYSIHKTVDMIIRYYDKNYFPKPAVFIEYKYPESI